jgi:ribosome-binding factor A
MPKNIPRHLRVGDQLQRALPEIIRQEIQESGLGFLTITGVKMSKDLSYATIYFTVMEDNLRQSSLALLAQYAPRLRHRLGEHLIIRSLPLLRFIYDQSEAQARHLDALIEHAVWQDAQKKTLDS